MLTNGASLVLTTIYDIIHNHDIARAPWEEILFDHIGLLLR